MCGNPVTSTCANVPAGHTYLENKLNDIFCLQTDAFLKCLNSLRNLNNTGFLKIFCGKSPFCGATGALCFGQHMDLLWKNPPLCCSSFSLQGTPRLLSGSG